jgi:secreted trypsin-like serine protease
MENAFISYLTIRVGSNEYSNGGSEHEVSRINIHPLYDDMFLNYDAVILTLKTYIKFDSFRRPIKLPYLYEPFITGSNVTTSGWGKTENNSSVSPILRMVELKIVDQVECFKAHEGFGGTTPITICASAYSKDACNGGLDHLKLLF